MLILKRITSLKDATLGVLLDPYNVPLCLTAELPWKNNEPYVSCIPPGIYQMMKIVSAKRNSEVYEIVGVPDRTNIQIHIANAPMRPINADGDTELLGCIAPGLQYGERDGYNGVLQSRPAFEKLMELPEQIIIKIQGNERRK